VSSISAVGYGGYNPVAALQRNLFNEVDTKGTGSITKGTLEQAVSAAGGTTQGADALFAQLDPNNTGSVTEQQFSKNLPALPFSDQMGAQLIGYQASGWPASSGGSPGGQLARSLFSQIDAGGTGSITKSELEQAVTSAGGTTQGADALYAKLDPNNTGSVTEQQFAQTLSQLAPHHHHDHDQAGNGSDPQGALASQPPSPTGNTAQDALLALIQSLSSTTSSGSPAGVTAVSGATGGNTAQDALSALIQGLGSNPAGSINGNSGQGNSAEAAVWSLLQNFASTQFGNPGAGQDPLMAMMDGVSAGGTSAFGTGNTEDALFSLMQGSSAGGHNGNGASAGNGTTSSSNLASALSLYQSQMNLQLFGGTGV